MKLMVVKMDDVRAVFARRGITGGDVDAAIAALPAWDWLSAKKITIADYIRDLDSDTDLLQYLNALIGEYADDGPGFEYLSTEDISFIVPASMSPADVANITASYKGE